jgi:hypothetical protein
LNYIGGAIIFVKAHYAERIATLLRSWKLCNKEAQDNIRDDISTSHEAGRKEEVQTQNQGPRWLQGFRKKKKQEHLESNDLLKAAESANEVKTNIGVQNVPTNYQDMFLFNAAVMASEEVSG